MKPYRFIIILLLLIFPALLTCRAQSGSPSKALDALNKEVAGNITILWTSGERDMFVEGIKPYCEACFQTKSLENMTLMAWGPSVCLLAKDSDLQKKLASLIEKGLEVKASRVLADKYSCKKVLTEMGAEIENINELLTRYLKDETRSLVSL